VHCSRAMTIPSAWSMTVRDASDERNCSMRAACEAALPGFQVCGCSLVS